MVVLNMHPSYNVREIRFRNFNSKFMHTWLCPILKVKSVSRYIYNQQKKKRTTTIFPLKIVNECENATCHEILVSDDILLKFECGVDEYLYLPCIGTKHIKANGKWVFKAFIQCYSLHQILSMLYCCKVWKRYVVVILDNLCVYPCFVWFKKHFHQIKLNKTMMKSLHGL